jgi:hypothetical protein
MVRTTPSLFFIVFIIHVGGLVGYGGHGG